MLKSHFTYLSLALLLSAGPNASAELTGQEKDTIVNNTQIIASAKLDSTPGTTITKQLSAFRSNAAVKLSQNKITRAEFDALEKDLKTYSEISAAWIKVLETQNNILSVTKRSYLPVVDLCSSEFGKSWQSERENSLKSRGEYIRSAKYKNEFGTSDQATEDERRPVLQLFERAQSYIRSLRGRCSTLIPLGLEEKLNALKLPDALNPAPAATISLGQKRCKELVDRLRKDQPGLDFTMEACLRDIYNNDGTDKRAPLARGMGRIEQPSNSAAAIKGDPGAAKPLPAPAASPLQRGSARPQPAASGT